MSKEKKEEKLNELEDELVTIDWDDDEVVPEFINKVDPEVANPEDGEDVTPEDNDDLEVVESEEDLIDKSSKKSTKSKSEDTKKGVDNSNGEEVEDNDDDIDSKKTTTPPSKNSKKSSPALIFAKFLSEKGVVSLEDEDMTKLNEVLEQDGEEAAFEYIFNKEVENRVTEIKSVYEDDVQEYISLRDYGIPADTAAKLVQNKNVFDQIKEDDIDSEENAGLRKEIIKRYLKDTTKMTDEDIEDQIETLSDTGKDIQWAKKSLNYLKKQSAELIEQEKKRIKEQEEQQKKQIEETKKTIKKAVMDTNEILGNKVTANMKSKIIKLLLEPAGEDPNGNPVDGVVAWLLKDPLKNRINLAYAIASGLLDGKLGSIKKKVKSEVISELENSVLEKSNMVGGSTTTINRDASNAMKALKEMFPDNNTF